MGPWVAIAFLFFWAGGTDSWPLLVASAGAMAGATLRSWRQSRIQAAGCALLVFGILVGFFGERQVSVVAADWDGYWDERIAETRVLLTGELNRRVEGGEQAADSLIAAWRASPQGVDVALVAELREQHRSSALAIYDGEGRLAVWDGTHRGKVPETVKSGELRHSYRDLPLFGYLYQTARGEDGSVAVAAYLLRASLPTGLGADVGDLATRFYGESGERIRITEDDPGISESVWDLALDDADGRLLSVVLQRPAAADRIADIRHDWAVRVALIAGLAWLLLTIAGTLGGGEPLAAAGCLVAAAAWLPVDRVAGVEHLFDATTFALPGPLAATLGRVALFALAAFSVVAVAPRPRARIPFWTSGIVAALILPAVFYWMRAGLGVGFLAEGRVGWVAYQFASAALASLGIGIAIRTTKGGAGSRMSVSLALGLAVLLMGATALWVQETIRPAEVLTAAWGVPVVLAAYGVTAWRGWQRSALTWVVAALLGSSASIPVTWGHQIEARLAEGTRRLDRLAAVEDVEIEDKLVDFAWLADSLDAAGAEDVSILYEGWTRSGLAELGHPVWLQIERRDGSPGEGLRVGVGDGEPQPYQDLLARGRLADAVRLVQLNEDDARYILTAPLSEGRMIVAVAPPFARGVRGDALGPLLRGTREADLEALDVLPLPPGMEPEEGPAEYVRTAAGWQAGLGIRFSNGPAYHAHYTVNLPGWPLAIARATLLAVLNVGLFMLFWAIGGALYGDPRREPMRFSRVGISFRARVTLALFGFFALANALFGTVAYRALSQASHRSAQVIAERVVEDAAGWYRALGGQMERIANQVGAELLEYRDGELREGSVEELVELGLYVGWIPWSVGQTLDGREAVRDFTETTVGRWEYVTAYRRLPDGDVLAAQVSLQAGTSALQTTDLIELLGFVILLGAALSLGLAMIAGRALTRPILALQIASESVGSGDLSLRLPAHRNDEFGAVFRAFNRMVGRVRRARRQLVRTSRRTQLIMNEAAVGMVALDPAGKVTLVNPRAEELLGAAVEVGSELPAEGALGEALGEWLSAYLEGSADEANSDFPVEERRVRVRVRRLGSFGAERGVVVALDDVTDELRAERVLAWGEMARQVAHEVKNPLTPIKLSIQHVRRAWDDKHPDFDSILVRNADAMLSEIDRLAEIAQSFSRFGAPGGQQAAPLAPVSLEDVVGEVMALYGGSAARVHFEQSVEPDLRPVVARTAELKEVLVNLLENARLAGEDGTRIVISARSADEPGHVLLTVTDDGAGIPEDVLPRIFEPQFSTRSKGTGLGLAIVQRVVRAWGGSVSVESTLGEGTVVSVVLRVWPDDGLGVVEPVTVS